MVALLPWSHCCSRIASMKSPKSVSLGCHHKNWKVCVCPAHTEGGVLECHFVSVAAIVTREVGGSVVTHAVTAVGTAGAHFVAFNLYLSEQLMKLML
jgi:hypothetical protein